MMICTAVVLTHHYVEVIYNKPFYYYLITATIRAYFVVAVIKCKPIGQNMLCIITSTNLIITSTFLLTFVCLLANGGAAQKTVNFFFKYIHVFFS